MPRTAIDSVDDEEQPNAADPRPQVGLGLTERDGGEEGVEERHPQHQPDPPQGDGEARLVRDHRVLASQDVRSGDNGEECRSAPVADEVGEHPARIKSEAQEREHPQDHVGRGVDP